MHACKDTHGAAHAHKLTHAYTHAGIASTLKSLLEDDDAVVRQRAAHALGIIAR